MDKRLEEIKNQLERFSAPQNKPCLFREDADWLIQQAEKAEVWHDAYRKEVEHGNELVKENQRYKEALEDIKINSRSDVNRAIEKACKALEGESE